MVYFLVQREVPLTVTVPPTEAIMSVGGDVVVVFVRLMQGCQQQQRVTAFDQLFIKGRIKRNIYKTLRSLC